MATCTAAGVPLAAASLKPLYHCWIAVSETVMPQLEACDFVLISLIITSPGCSTCSALTLDTGLTSSADRASGAAAKAKAAARALASRARLEAGVV